MMAVLAAVAVTAATPTVVPPLPVPLAQLQVVADGPAMIVTIRDVADGRTLTIDCVDRCPRSSHFSELFDDTPLGLLQPFDREPIVVAIAAGGSVYHVRAYRLSATHTVRILDVATRAAPGFAVARDGAIVVTTTERSNDAASGHDRRVTWTWRGARFERNEHRAQ